MLFLVSMSLDFATNKIVEETQVAIVKCFKIHALECVLK